MNDAVLEEIAEFVDGDQAIVIKMSDWKALREWIVQLRHPDRPNFHILPISFD